jgi:hypothetical protein
MEEDGTEEVTFDRGGLRNCQESASMACMLLEEERLNCSHFRSRHEAHSETKLSMPYEPIRGEKTPWVSIASIP